MNRQCVHFIGIGGSGISALALLYIAQGKTVTGSDVAESVFSLEVQAAGGRVTLGHHGDNVPEGVGLVVFSEAIDKATNPEYVVAQQRGIKTMSYFEALGEFSKTKKTIVVTGTHGKTTTTAMLGEALIAAGVDPTVIVGTRVPSFTQCHSEPRRGEESPKSPSYSKLRHGGDSSSASGRTQNDTRGSNLYIGKSEWFVVEGCEYRRSFLNFHPFGVVMLNCEAEHLDYYKDEEDYRNAFRELMMKIPTCHSRAGGNLGSDSLLQGNDKGGFLVINGKDKNLNQVAEEFRGHLIRVDEAVGLQLTVPGKFNEWNAACALAAAMQVGAEEGVTRRALEAYCGSGRRMEVKGEAKGMTLVDDYGHHPTEVRLTLEALKQKYPGRRLICVFQPHQYSRTHQLLDQFKTSFGAADYVIIPNIYEARDSAEDKMKISAESLVAAIGEKHPHVEWGRDFATTQTRLKDLLKPGDVLVTMGAGDIGTFAEQVLDNIFF